MYLSPTISPCDTSELPDRLEHPSEVFAYFRYGSISSVICEEKHMGSRAIVVVGRDAATIERRFGITGQGVGACYTRTGRRFFEDRTIEAQFLLRVCDALTATGLWAELGINWVVLDSELMPWSFKAQELLREQYAAVGVAASTSLKVARQLLGQTEARQADGVHCHGKARTGAARHEVPGEANIYASSTARSTTCRKT